MLDYSSMPPEDLGSDEEDMHDYVDIMPVYATIPRAVRTCSCSTTLPWSVRICALTERTCMTMFTSSSSMPALALMTRCQAVMSDYSSTGPEDMGSDEEDMRDYVDTVPDYACIGFDDAVSCSTTLPGALRLWTLTKRACTIMLTSCLTHLHGFVMTRSGTTAVPGSHGLW